VLVEPLFNSFESLPGGELRTAVLALADEEEVPVEDVLVADASRRTTTLNAYVSGFGGTRRIVLYDNLVEDLPQEQALSVVAHELAHARHSDVVVGSVLGVAGAFCRLRRRRLIFASSTDADFTLTTLTERIRSVVYRGGLRCVDAVVVQTGEQLRLVQERFPRIGCATHIPSFAEPMERAERPGKAFLWIGRIVDYKAPLEFVKLARAMPEATFRLVATPFGAHRALYDELVRQASSNVELLIS